MALPNDRCIDLAVAEVHELAEVVGGADMSAPVPTCPEWDVAALLRHVGRVHRWAATMVERRSQQRLGREDGFDAGVPDDDAALPQWIEQGASFVRARFLDADPDDAMWAWGTPKQVGFWPRRMVHETRIHRADAEFALGIGPEITTEVGADGIDELLDNLPHAAYFAEGVKELKGDGEVLALHAPDAAAAWRIDLGPDGFTWSRTDGPTADADATVRAGAGPLYLLLYGRLAPDADGIDVDGSDELLAHWLAHSSL